jgi:hypothetical protein
MEQPKHFAFVLMPFDAAFDDVYKLGIKGAVAQFDDLLAERVDEQIYREGILERIYRQIEVADIIIADMTGQNPNVFYEVGYAHAKGKLCILLTSKAADIPFDLKHQRHIVYGGSLVTLKRELGKELEWARGEIEKQRASHIKVSLQKNVWGLLEKTKYTASAEIPLVVDMENTSSDKAITIQALYFYSKKQWNLYQDDRECAFTTADQRFANRGFERKHFLNTPLQVLQKGAWAQLKFEVRGTLANSFKGEELQDSYKVRGVSVLRIVTADGNFDFDLPIDVEVNEIPF